MRQEHGRPSTTRSSTSPDCASILSESSMPSPRNDMTRYAQRKEMKVMKETPRSIHGTLRGLDGVPASSQFEGRFGRLFRTLPPARLDEEDLKSLAAVMIAEAGAQSIPEEESDCAENAGTLDHPRIS